MNYLLNKKLLIIVVDSVGYSVDVREYVLTKEMRKYYSNLTKKERYMQYQNDGLDYSDLNTLSNSIYKKMTGEHFSYGLLHLEGGANEAEQWQACLSFANYLFHCIK